jgi:adenylate cyclase
MLEYKPSILVVDDTPANLTLMTGLLQDDYQVRAATSGEKALKIAFSDNPPDLILLDIMMPEMDGHEVCRRLKADDKTREIPVIFLTAMSEVEDEEKGLNLGAVDYITKPVSPPIALVRIRSHLALYQSLRSLELTKETIRKQAEQLKLLNSGLEKRVEDQDGQLDRLNIMKEFFSPQISEAIVGQGMDIFKTHRVNVTVVFLDLRGFTYFSDNTEPEEVMAVLGGYHEVMGEIINACQGTVGHFAGDGLMVYFNDPIPQEGHIEIAAQMCIKMMAEFKPLMQKWRKQGFDLDLGIGFANGYATLGTIGFDGRRDYACIGSVCNLAARLCAEAKGGQIFTNLKTYRQIDDLVNGQEVEDLNLKGFTKAVQTVEVLSLKE